MRTVIRTFTDGPSKGHQLVEHQRDINLNWRTVNRKSTGGPSTNHLLEDHQQTIYWRTINKPSKISSGGQAAGFLLEDRFVKQDEQN